MLIIKNILLAMLNGLKRRAAKFGVAGKGEMLIVYRVVFFFSFFFFFLKFIFFNHFFPCPSGGIERDWSGVPRKYYKPGSESSRCACIKLTEEMKQSSHTQRMGNLEEYEGCSPDAEACYVQD